LRIIQFFAKLQQTDEVRNRTLHVLIAEPVLDVADRRIHRRSQSSAAPCAFSDSVYNRHFGVIFFSQTIPRFIRTLRNSSGAHFVPDRKLTSKNREVTNKKVKLLNTNEKEIRKTCERRFRASRICSLERPFASAAQRKGSRLEIDLPERRGSEIASNDWSVN
jgi:hypothetical protein